MSDQECDVTDRASPLPKKMRLDNKPKKNYNTHTLALCLEDLERDDGQDVSWGLTEVNDMMGQLTDVSEDYHLSKNQFLICTNMITLIEKGFRGTLGPNGSKLGHKITPNMLKNYLALHSSESCFMTLYPRSVVQWLKNWLSGWANGSATMALSSLVSTLKAKTSEEIAEDMSTSSTTATITSPTVAVPVQQPSVPSTYDLKNDPMEQQLAALPSSAPKYTSTSSLVISQT